MVRGAIVRNEPVDWCTFGRKGCWGCRYFSGLAREEYVDVAGAVQLLAVSSSTVRRWIRAGVLKGTLYRRGRPWFSLSSPPAKYVIERGSVERVPEARASRASWAMDPRPSHGEWLRKCRSAYSSASGTTSTTRTVFFRVAGIKPFR